MAFKSCLSLFCDEPNMGPGPEEAASCQSVIPACGIIQACVLPGSQSSCACTNQNHVFHFYPSTDLISIADAYNVLTFRWVGTPSCRKGICGLKPAKARCCLQKTFFYFVESFMLSSVCTPPHAGLTKPRRLHTLLINTLS